MINTEKLKHEYMIPVAILAAGILLSITAYMVRTHQFANAPKGDASLIRPVTTLDHVIGNPTAPVVIIEYADMDSLYTKQFQATMEQLMSEYASSGKVAWVYRHLPLPDKNPRSEEHAHAAECAGSLAGPEAFWRFINALQTNGDNLDLFTGDDYNALLPALRINSSAFMDCMSSGRFSKRIQDDAVNGLAGGATASPFIVVQIKGKKPSTLSGSLPYEQMRKIIIEAVAQGQG